MRQASRPHYKAFGNESNIQVAPGAYPTNSGFFVYQNSLELLKNGISQFILSLEPSVMSKNLDLMQCIKVSNIVPSICPPEPTPWWWDCVEWGQVCRWCCDGHARAESSGADASARANVRGFFFNHFHCFECRLKSSCGKLAQSKTYTESRVGIFFQIFELK